MGAAVVAGSPKPSRKRPTLKSKAKSRKSPPPKLVATNPIEKDPFDYSGNLSIGGNQRVPLPRPERKPRRAKTDRGLPSDDELTKLASAFLEQQRKHWPKVVVAGLFPEPTPQVLAEMVDDFKRRHRGAVIDPQSIQPFTKFGAELGGNYDRYSCFNSMPTSILDQMVKSLAKAHSENRLIPWQYVFADYSVTGTDASRQGYSSYKIVLADPKHLIDTTYIDDFTRASRDEHEWWKLGTLSKRLRKRMIGASDGFDLDSPNSDIMISMYGLMSRLFLKGLKQKVKRGMAGAARRGTCTGKLSLGFTRRAHWDSAGKQVVDAQGLPIYEPCIDPGTCDARLLMYRMFIEQNLSAYAIAREFNRLKIDGWNGWNESAIKKLLRRPDAIGVFIWNKGHREFDPEEEKYVIVRHPRKEWQVRYSRNLAIVPLELWRAARRKLAALRRASSRTGKTLSRNQVSATTLFSGTLICEYCDAELKLNRSTPKYKQTACLNGLQGGHDCQLSSSKSTRIVEECLLAYLRNTILTEAHLEGIVNRANEHLAVEAQKPQVDTQPWKVKMRKAQATIKRLMWLIDDEEDQSLCVPHSDRIKELQGELIELRGKIHDAERTSQKRTRPLAMDKARIYLDQLRKTLNGDIPVAAAAIRAITGPIKVRQEPIPGRKKGARWIATFSPDLFRALQQLAQGNIGIAPAEAENCAPLSVEVVLDKIPRYESMAAKFKELRDKGASIVSIASAHKTTPKYAREILEFADTGKRPRFRSGKRTGTGNQAKYAAIAAEVIKLSKKKMSFAKIAVKLDVNESTVRRAFDYASPSAVIVAAENGERPHRATYSHLGEDVYTIIRKMLKDGKRPSEIVQKAGCSLQTVYRVKKQLEVQLNPDETDAG